MTFSTILKIDFQLIYSKCIYNVKEYRAISIEN